MQEPYHWSHRTAYAWILLPISWVYYALVSLRLSLIKPTKLSVPVICIGNNTVGGAGKTPTAIAVANWLKEKGYNPAFISRGYKGQYIGTMVVDADKHSAAEVGDEPLLLARHAICVVAKRRMNAASKAIELGANVIIMDDGLQNPSLLKDMTILVVDGTYGFGNGFVMPAGPCREPVTKSMQKADVILLMGEQKNDRLASYLRNRKPIFNARMKASDDLTDKRLHPFAGIAHPDKFFGTVVEQGAQVIRTSRFDDHHAFTQRDLDRLMREAAEDNAELITTEKDAVRLPESFRSSVRILPVSLQCDQQEQLLELIEQMIETEEN